MPIQEFSPFPTSQAYSSFDFSPLARLGQSTQQRQLSDLARYAATNPTQDITSPSAAPIVPSLGGTSAPYSAPATTADVNKAIGATAAKAGMDPATWAAIASIESSMNPSSNFNKPTQYKGLFQIGAHEFAAHGKGDTYNPMDNAIAAANLAKANNDWFRAQFGREPTPTETYMMHQQGPGFYSKGKMTNVEGNPYPGMSGPQTPESFAAGWANEIERRRKFFARNAFAGEM